MVKGKKKNVKRKMKKEKKAKAESILESEISAQASKAFVDNKVDQITRSGTFDETVQHIKEVSTIDMSESKKKQVGFLLKDKFANFIVESLETGKSISKKFINEIRSLAKIFG